MNLKSFAIVVLTLPVWAGCSLLNNASAPAPDRRSEVFQARSVKDESSLLRLAADPDLKVRQAAWRALANISVQDVDSLMGMALRDGSDVALFSLTLQRFSPGQLRRLEAAFEGSESMRGSIVRVLGIAGDRATLPVLIGAMDSSFGTAWEAEFALAVNRRLMADGPSPDVVRRITARSLVVKDPMVRRAWLYGMFRSPSAWIGADQAELLFTDFSSTYAAADPFIRQMTVNILGKSTHPALPAFMGSRSDGELSHIELTELVRALYRYPVPDATLLNRLLDRSLDEANIPLALDILNTAHTLPAAAPLIPGYIERVRSRVRVAEPIDYAVMRLEGAKPTVMPENPALTGEYLALMGDTDEAIAAMKAHPDRIRAYLAALRRPETVVPDVTDSTLIVPPASIVNQRPVWILETSEGRIVIELDGLRTPASAYAISKIAAEGYYTGTFFHRVIQNFVIQAGLSFVGDRREPNFTVPTEGVETHFERGSVGVASAGRDTEGGQFFIMHQWMPHLNGRYSNIGRVVEGMDVVDRVWQGTLIHSSRIVLP